MLNNKQQGFTLIELLVVISIIGLLSSIVLASLQTARQKARNAAKNALVSEFRNALEIYFTSNGSYPYNGIALSSGYPFPKYCLGYSSGEGCFYPFDQIASAPDPTALNNALRPYIPGPPANRGTISVGGSDWSAIAYACASIDGNGNCLQYSLRWLLEGTGQSCGPGKPEDYSSDPDSLWGIISLEVNTTNTSCYLISS